MDNVIRKITALLNTNGCTEAEAEARLAKAQELLAKHNLDMAIIGKDKKTGPEARNDTKRKGGLYSWQRKLWKAVAELNFCYYLSVKGLAKGSTYEHRLIGSQGNVIATEVMARYLQEVIEKLAQTWAKENGYGSVFVRDAIAYREGMTARVTMRLAERRQAVITEERQKAERAKQEAARTGDTTGNALTILDIISTEADLNYDYVNDWELGTTARQRAEREAYSRKFWDEYFAKEKAQAEWDAAHPEEAAARKAKEAEDLRRWTEKEAKKEARRKTTQPRARKLSPEEERAGLYAFRKGHADGAQVGIDQQVKGTSKKEAIR
jgi:hypothetical protein